MGVSDASREAVLQAIRDFDERLRSKPEWSNWEHQYDYALDLGGQLYPAKQILSMATGIGRGDFSGGEQTNRPLTKLGFTIVNLHKEPNGSGDSQTSLKHCLETILTSYAEVRQATPFGYHQELWTAFENARELLLASPAIKKRPTIKVSWGVGKGNWAKVPWIALLDSRETDATTSGVYGVFLFREDMSGVYATLNQGVTKPTRERGDRGGVEWLRNNASYLRSYCTNLPDLGFAIDGQIVLRAGSRRGTLYESSTIAHKFYARGSLPSDSVILEDIEGILQAYDRYISADVENTDRAENSAFALSPEHRAWIFQANPELYDIDAAITELDEMTWLVRTHAKEIQTGDRVFIWKSGRTSGIVALGTVMDSPKSLEEGEQQKSYSRSADKFSNVQLRVPLKVTKRTWLSRDLILKDSRLRGLSILRFQQGTNFAVTREEEQVLMELLLGANPEHEGVEARRVWLISPGRSAEHWDEFYREGIVGIGWDELGDLSNYKSLEQVRTAISATYQRDEPTNDALACFEFAHVMKPGDLVLAKKGRSAVVGYGTVIGDYVFDATRTYYQSTRKVRWEGRGDWSYDGHLVMKTLTDITRYPNHVEELEKLVGRVQKAGPEPLPAKERTPYSLDEAIDGLFFTKEEFEKFIGLWQHKKNLILQGPPGVGKTFVARRLAYALMGYRDPSRLGMVQFHQSYSYEDFIQGYRPSGEGFALKNGLFHEFCERAQRDQDNRYVFIIDEINRGNLSKIFGELLMLLETDKRGSEWSIPLTYATSDEVQFYVPENLFVLGLMNTADRSLAVVDYALRRRFAFATLSPKFGTPAFREYHSRAGVSKELTEQIINRISQLNDAIAGDVSNLGSGFQIGHSFFTPSVKGGPFDQAWYERVIDNEIVPLLEEYWFENADRVKEWRSRLLHG